MKQKVCPAEHAGMLDVKLRHWIHPMKDILAPYINEGDRVLDIGCGPGTFTDSLVCLAGESGEVIAVDLQPLMLEKMEVKMMKAGFAGRVVSHICRTDSLLLESREGSIDFALAFWMAHETPDISSFLKEVYQSLKSGGSLLCVEPKLHVSQRIYDDMVDIAEDTGFIYREVKGIRLSRTALFTK